jgi:calcium permeable stress-gated cation channel
MVSLVAPSSCSINFTSIFPYMYTNNLLQRIQGLFYPKAYQQVLVGMYVQQIYLCALFFLSTDSQGRHSSVAEGALMVVLMVITVSKILFLTFVRKDQLGYIFQAAFHAILNNSYDPLLKALPLGLQDRTYSPPSDKIVDESNQN